MEMKSITSPNLKLFRNNDKTLNCKHYPMLFFGFVLKKATLTPSDINLRNKIISEQQLQPELFKVPA